LFCNRGRLALELVPATVASSQTHGAAKPIGSTFHLQSVFLTWNLTAPLLMIVCKMPTESVPNHVIWIAGTLLFSIMNFLVCMSHDGEDAAGPFREISPD
jgi:hypothetical protein